MSHRPRITVAITGMNSRADNPGPGLAVARCLLESNLFDLRIIGLSYDAMDPGLYHPFCDATYLLPYPSAGVPAVRERLLEIHEKERLNALIPCLDSELLNLTVLEPELNARGIRVSLPTESQLQARDKNRLSDLTKKAGVSYPETRAITNPSFFSHTDDWHYPFVVKGRFYDAYVVKDQAAGVEAFKKISSTWGIPILVQRLIEGEEYNLSAIGDGNGKMLGSVMMKKRGLTEKGKAWSGVCVYDEAMQAMAEALFKTLRWRGPLEIEGIRDTDGNYHLLEINPRFPAWIYLSAGVGRNLPALQLSIMLDTERPKMAETAIGTTFIRYAQEVIVPLENFEAMMIRGEHTPVDFPPIKRG